MYINIMHNAFGEFFLHIKKSIADRTEIIKDSIYIYIYLVHFMCIYLVG